MEPVAKRGQFVASFAEHARNIFLNGKGLFSNIADYQRRRPYHCLNIYGKVVEFEARHVWYPQHRQQSYDMLVLLGNMDWQLTTSLSLFPPETKEVQFDEKWSFVYKKQAQCAEDETERGDNWDHTAIDAEHRLLLSIIPGKRTAEKCLEVVEDVKEKTGGRTDILFTSDEHAPYKTAIVIMVRIVDKMLGKAVRH